MNHSLRFCIVLLFALTLSLVCSAAALAAADDVTVTTGPTSIVEGEAAGVNDITIQNGIFAIAISVDTVPPWGVPNGSILDGGLVKDGTVADRITLIDYLPDGWAAWPCTGYDVAITTATPDQAVVTVTRDYDVNIQLVTTYTVDKGSNAVRIRTVATNPVGSSKTYDQLYSGYTFCTSGGYMFGPYALGLAGTGRLPYPTTPDPYGKYVLGYDETYSIGLHNAQATNYSGGTGWKDLYTESNYAPGDSKTFDAVVEFNATPSISSFVKHVIDERSDDFGAVSGSVTAASGSFGVPPVVVVERNGEPFSWVEASGGSYSIDLPVGTYDIYAVAKGYSTADKISIDITSGSALTQDFLGLMPQTKITVGVRQKSPKKALDARIDVAGGTAPLIAYLGRSVYFTDFANVGHAEFNLAPGAYTLTISAGAGFLAKPVTKDITVVAGRDQTLKIEVPKLADPQAQRWFSADMHHHSNYLDGVTPPKDVILSQLAAGLDLGLISDHDTAAGYPEGVASTAARRLPFIPAMEISPIWGHFNGFGYPLTNAPIIDTSGSAQQIIDDAHAAGLLVSINHPYIPFGYWTADDEGFMPGGYSDDFDFIELQSTRVTDGGTPDERTLARALQTWTGAVNGENKRHYFSAGSDIHDIWGSYQSGYIRLYANIPAPQKVNARNFLVAAKAGHAYVTQGPLVRPQGNINFGDTITVTKAARGASQRVPFGLKVSAVDGLKSVSLVQNGVTTDTRTFAATKTSAQPQFNITVSEPGWVCFIVEDRDGDRAVTNPIWTDVKTRGRDHAHDHHGGKNGHGRDCRGHWGQKDRRQKGR